MDWRKIEDDLLGVMKKVVSMRKKGNLIDAAIIAGYVMTITCREFKHDHQTYTPARYDVWAEENKVLRNIITQLADMVWSYTTVASSLLILSSILSRQ